MRYLFHGVLFATTALCSPLLAMSQEVADPAGTAAANTDSPRYMSSVVVTAQKREQRLQDVPVPVSAVGDAQLEAQGILEMGDLTRIVPGLVYTQNTAFSQPTIRGIGTRSTSAGDSSSVAQYIDGVYLSGPQAGIFDFGYIDRVEVLKGPQGTLFGRNATGGAINVITRTPSADGFAEAEIGYGSYNLVSAKAYATGGLATNVRGDIQGFYRKDDGYVTNIVSGKDLPSADNQGIRTKLIWDVTDNFSLTGAADYVSSANQTGYALQAIDGNNLRKRLVPSAILATRPHEISYSLEPSQETTQSGVSVIADLDVGGLNIKSITAARTLDNENWYDTDGTSVPASGILLASSGDTFTEEVIISSDASKRLSWLGGVFFIHDISRRDPQTTFGANLQTGANRRDIKVETISYAPYGEMTFRATDKLVLIGGLRYSYEKKELSLAVNQAPIRDESTSWDNVDYRLTAQYFLNDDLNLYFTHSTGFKSGTYNAASATNPPVEPETVTAYELGAKFGGRNITLNGDVFYYEQEDLQVQRAFDINTGTAQLENAAKARIYGIEGEINARLNDYFTASLGASLMDGEYTDYPLASVTIPVVGGGNTSSAMDVSGLPTYRTPDVTLNANLVFQNDLFGGHFVASGGVYHASEFSWESSNRLVEPSHTLLNARASWSPQSDRYKISIWGDNLSDEFYYTNAVASAAGDSGGMGPPRRVGISISFKTN